MWVSNIFVQRTNESRQIPGGVGPWHNESKELNRKLAPREPLPEVAGQRPGLFQDARRYGFRHGAMGGATGGLAGDTYGGLAYFDGHVERKSDLEATDPHLWFPTGTKLRSPTTFWVTTRERFSSIMSQMSLNDPYVVP